MKISNPKRLKDKDLVIFDLDGTLAQSKSAMDAQMVKVLSQLLASKKVAVISGGEMKQFQIQLLGPLRGQKLHWQNLYLFPTTSTAFYRRQSGKWQKVYSHSLSKVQVKKIRKAFQKAFEQIGYRHPAKTYGQVIENRATQVTFSALGQKIVAVLGKQGVKLKQDWARHHDVRPQIAKHLQKLLPQFKVRTAGLTSVDVTQKGIDKAYGVRQIQKHLKFPISRMLFVGDAIFPGGNDYEALKTGIDYVAVEGPQETKNLIKKILA